MSQSIETLEAFHVPAPVLADPRSLPVRFSNLKNMERSPAHYLHSARNGLDETLSMRIGSGTHAMLLGKPWVVFTGKVRNGKVWDAFEAEHADKVILNVREYEQAKAMSSAVRAHPLAAKLLEGCEFERTIKWRHGLDRECQSTPDAFKAGTLIELKSTRDSNPDRFVRDGRFRMYHGQLAFYEDAIAYEGLGAIEERYIIAVESAAPHVVTVLRVTDQAIERGRSASDAWMERLLVCEMLDHWPGYVEELVDFDVDGDPAPAIADNESDLESIDDDIGF